jgi:hypothetical protein
MAHGASRGDESILDSSSPVRGNIRAAQSASEYFLWADVAPAGAQKSYRLYSSPTALAVGHIISALTGLRSLLDDMKCITLCALW